MSKNSPDRTVVRLVRCEVNSLSPFCDRKDLILIGRCGIKDDPNTDTNPLGCRHAYETLTGEAAKAKPGTRMELTTNDGDQMILQFVDSEGSNITIESGAKVPTLKATSASRRPY